MSWEAIAAMSAVATIFVSVILFIIGWVAKALSNKFEIIFGKLDDIRKELTSMKLDMVTHNVCDKRREDCPCWREIEHLKESLTEKKAV